MVAELLACARLRNTRGEFQPARVGGDVERRRVAALRGDLTCWLDQPLMAAEENLYAQFERLRLAINGQGWLGLFELEAHYARYPPGAGYVRHVDQLDGRDERVVSVVLYLNENWDADAGGELRLFERGGPRDIAPVAGRLVCFLAAGTEHAVLPARRERWSVTGWFRRRPVDPD